MRRSHEQVADEILVARPHADAAFAAPPLAAVGGDGGPLDIAGVGDRDRHVFFGDQILDVQLARLTFDDLRPPVVAVRVADRLQLVDDDLHQQTFACQDGAQPFDGLQQVGELVENLLALQPGQALQLHVENCLRLDERQTKLPDQSFARFGWRS